jgi:enoyl-CoA hydratase/carnithine racemase
MNKDHFGFNRVQPRTHKTISERDNPMPDLVYEKKGRIAYITLNRPASLNAMTNQMKRRLNEIWFDFRDDPEVWVAIIAGAGGRAFSTGSDVKEFTTMEGFGQGIIFLESGALQEGHMDLWKPLIAAIDGWCVAGGLELALCSDIRIATEKSKFGLTQPKIGRIAGGGGTMRLPDQIPFAIAMEMLLTGDPIDARRAYEVGLINQVVASSEELMPAAEKMAERILACAPLPARLSKEQVLRGFNLPIPTQLALLRIGREVEASEDAVEGSKAFAEKRKPQWKNK